MLVFFEIRYFDYSLHSNKSIQNFIKKIIKTIIWDRWKKIITILIVSFCIRILRFFRIICLLIERFTCIILNNNIISNTYENEHFLILKWNNCSLSDSVIYVVTTCSNLIRPNCGNSYLTGLRPRDKPKQ